MANSIVNCHILNCCFIEMGMTLRKKKYLLLSAAIRFEINSYDLS